MLKIDINLLFTVINILLLAIAMRMFFWTPVKKIIAERQSMVDKDLACAKEAKENAETLEQQHKKLLEEAQSEKDRILDEARQAAFSESEKIIADSKAEALKIIDEAKAEAKKQQMDIYEETQKEISEMVMNAVTKLALSDDGDSQLYDRFLAKAREERD